MTLHESICCEKPSKRSLNNSQEIIVLVIIGESMKNRNRAADVKAEEESESSEESSDGLKEILRMIVLELFRDGFIREAVPHDVMAEEHFRALRFIERGKKDNKKKKVKKPATKVRQSASKKKKTVLKSLCALLARSIKRVGAKACREAASFDDRRLQGDRRQRR